MIGSWIDDGDLSDIERSSDVNRLWGFGPLALACALGVLADAGMGRPSWSVRLVVGMLAGASLIALGVTMFQIALLLSPVWLTVVVLARSPGSWGGLHTILLVSSFTVVGVSLLAAGTLVYGK